MKLVEFKKDIVDFRNKVVEYSNLYVKSCDGILQKIIKNYEALAKLKTTIRMNFGKLEFCIKKFGKYPYINNGVNFGTYSVYSNAFSDDIPLRVGSSLGYVIQDLEYIIGKLEDMTEKDFKGAFKERKKNNRANYWNYVNLPWLIYRLLVLAWDHRIITGIIVGLVVAFLAYKLGWK